MESQRHPAETGYSSISEGDIIEPEDDVKVKVLEVQRKQDRKPGGSKRKIDPEQFKKNNPVLYEKKGRAPEYSMRFPAITVATSVIGEILD